MIDFRYHLVSLISVFVALAVGIVLGAGPLQERIGDTLTDQIDVLRTDRDRLRLDLAEKTVDVAERDAWISDVGEQITGASLAGRAVALVVLPGASDDDVAAVAAHLDVAQAGAAAHVRLTEAWFASDPSYRQTFAQQLAGYLDPVPSVEATSEEVLAVAVAQMLAGRPQAGVLSELLVGGEEPFVAFDEDVTAPASALVVVGPRPAPEPDPETTPTAAPQPEWVRVVSGLAATLPTVTIGAADELILQIREAGVATSTIDGVEELTAVVSVPLAVTAELNGVHGHYGFSASAETPAPRIVPAPPLPEPAVEGEQG